MKPPLFLLVITILLAIPTIIASSCDNIVCPAVVIPLPKECTLRKTHEIPEDVCTCVWDKCSCGYSCHFPQCSSVNTTVTCPGEPCQAKNCQYGCTNHYCTGCEGFCWEKPYTPTTTSPPTTTTMPCDGVCPAVVVPLPDACQIRNANATSECLCEWDQCFCRWACSIPSITPCPDPVQCLIDPCSTTTCATGTVCRSSYCGACTATCVPVEGPTTPTPDCPNPVQCLVDPCASMSCVTGTVCETNYCYGCNATCKPIATEKPPLNCDGVKCVDPCVAMTCATGNICVKTDCCHATCAPLNTSPTNANDTSTCYYNNQTYTQGQTTKSIDGCNTCTCMNGDMACTLMACSATGNNNNVTCTTNGRTYTPGQRMMSLDGCNTCTCEQDGRIACTLMGCFNNTATYVGVTSTVLLVTTVAVAMIV